jgi:hypothetical protein
LRRSRKWAHPASTETQRFLLARALHRAQSMDNTQREQAHNDSPTREELCLQLKSTLEVLRDVLDRVYAQQRASQRIVDQLKRRGLEVECVLDQQTWSFR